MCFQMTVDSDQEHIYLFRCLLIKIAYAIVPIIIGISEAVIIAMLPDLITSYIGHDKHMRLPK